MVFLVCVILKPSQRTPSPGHFIEMKANENVISKQQVSDECDDAKTIGSNFQILKKNARSVNSIDYLIFGMLFSYIRKLKPKLNKQSDPIRAKLFAQLFHFLWYCFSFLELFLCKY